MTALLQLKTADTTIAKKFAHLNACFAPVADSTESHFELGSEQTLDGAFRRNPISLTAHFGDQPGQAPVEPGRYHVVGVPRCGWNRRQRIVLRLLGLDTVVIPEVAYGRDEHGWRIVRKPGGVAERFGTDRVNDFYRRTDSTFQPDPSKPNFKWRGTTPVVIDTVTGKVVSNNYHTLTNEWETAWKPFHKPGAPDLYPEDLRPEINLLNQQIFDDVNNGTYKVVFARNPKAARDAYNVYEARLIDYDFRLKSRRYLFGDRLTDSDIRLFQTLESYEFTYRPGLVKKLGTDDILHVDSLPNLWAYARDLFQTPGFIDDIERYELGFVTFRAEDVAWYGENPYNDGDLYEIGKYSFGWTHDPHNPLGNENELAAERKAHYEAWLEPSGREHLGGSPLYSGPGGGGSYQLWEVGADVTPYYPD